MSVLEKINDLLAESLDQVFLRSEFLGCGSASQVDRVLGSLIRHQRLMRVGRGVFVRTKTSCLSGRIIATVPLELAVDVVFKKLGVSLAPCQAVREYNAGKTTQIPVKLIVCTPGRNISRKLSIGKQTLFYEHMTKD